MTDTLPFLEVLSAALREAEQALTTDGLEVIPVVLTDSLDDGAPDRLLLDAVVRHRNGVVLDAAAGPPRTVAGQSDVLSAAVRASLRVRTDTGLQPLEVRVEADEIRLNPADAVVTGHAESGVAELVGLATALFDRRIVGRQLAVLLYRETLLDPAAAEAAWSFVTTQLATVPIETLRALIVVVQASRIVSARHCGAGETMRYGIRDDRPVERHSWHSDQAKIRAISRVDDPLVLFLGAGFSASSHLPMGDELRDETLRSMFGDATYLQLADRFHQHLGSNRQLADGEQERGEFIRTLTLERVLEEQLRLTGTSPTLDRLRAESEEALRRAPSLSVQHLRRIASAGRKLVLVTVNFDRLIEAGGGLEVFVTREDFGRFPSYLDEYMTRDGMNVPLLKLHGTIEAPDSIIATVGQVAAGLMPERREALLALARRNPRWIYVGYSMRDPDVTAVLASEEFQEGVQEHWVGPLPGMYASEFVASRRRARPDFMERSITQSSDSFLTLLGEAW